LSFSSWDCFLPKLYLLPFEFADILFFVSYQTEYVIRKNQSLDVNTYWAHEHYSGKAKQFLTEMISAMKGPEFFDHTDAQSDYFHCSHYIDINIGKWDKPYIVETV
jgi:hypothetical protein